MLPSVFVLVRTRALAESLGEALAHAARGYRSIICSRPDELRAQMLGSPSPALVVIDGRDPVVADWVRSLGSSAAVLVLGGPGAGTDVAPPARFSGGPLVLAQDTSLAQLIRTIEGILADTFSVDSVSGAGVARNPIATAGGYGGAQNGGHALTARETEVVELISEGMSNKEIAKRLGIRPATVKNHVHSILEKLKLRRRVEVVAHYGRDRGRADRAWNEASEEGAALTRGED